MRPSPVACCSIPSGPDLRFLGALAFLLFLSLPAQAQNFEYFMLEMGWLPGQCLVDPKMPICADLSLQNEQARNLTLIGLKPEPRPGAMALRDCDPISKAFTTPAISPQDKVTSCSLPALKLDKVMQAELADLMPDIAACPERAYWAKYGSCAMLSPARYFERAVARARDIQNSLLNVAIAGAMGKRITRETLAEAFEMQFGPETARSLQLICTRSKEHRQQVLTGVRIAINQIGSMRNLTGDGLWHAPGVAFSARCPDEFLVAEPGAEEPPLPEKPLFEDPFATPE